MAQVAREAHYWGLAAEGVASKWKPLSLRGKEGETTFDVLHEGVPVWLRPSLDDWVRRIITGNLGGERMVLLTMRDLHMGGEPPDFYDRLETDDEFLLNVVDYFLSLMPSSSEVSSHVLTLETHLKKANSVWTVRRGSDHYGLERRVASEVRQAASEIVEQGGKVGHHLGRAWENVFGRKPDPSLAFREAILAVETAAVPVVLPKDQKATLGRIIGHIRDHSSDFDVSLQPQDSRPVDTLVQMLGLLWSSQWDRHGFPAEGQDFHVGPKEAEAAVVLATTLTHWFQAGVVKRKSS